MEYEVKGKFTKNRRTLVETIANTLHSNYKRKTYCFYRECTYC